MRRRIVIFAVDGNQPLDVVGPFEVFAGLEQAGAKLGRTGMAVEAVAASSGFGTPESLRRAFARGVSLSPREYRARFGNPPGGAVS